MSQVNDKIDAACWVGWRCYPYLMSQYREEVDQELALLVHQYPENMDLYVWGRIVSKSLYQLCKELGIKRGRGEKSYTPKERVFSAIVDGENENAREKDFEKLLGSNEEWTEGVEGTVWFEQTLKLCRNILDEYEWALFVAYLQGISQKEIKKAFQVNGDLKRVLRDIINRIREAAEVPLSLPMPV